MTTELLDIAGNDTENAGTAIAKRTTSGWYVMADHGGVLFEKDLGLRGITVRDRDRGCVKYRMQRCSEECYSRFVRYLKSGNKAHLLVAQREFFNG